MGVMTAATAVWWASLADAAPWFLAGWPPQLMAATALMVLATTVLGATGPRGHGGATSDARFARTAVDLSSPGKAISDLGRPGGCRCPRRDGGDGQGSGRDDEAEQLTVNH